MNDRGFALQRSESKLTPPSLEHCEKTAAVIPPPFPDNNQRPTRLRLPSLRARLSTEIAIEQQQISKFKKSGRAPKKKPTHPLPSATPLKDPSTSKSHSIAVRNHKQNPPRRSEGIPPAAFKAKSTQLKKTHNREEPAEAIRTKLTQLKQSPVGEAPKFAVRSTPLPLSPSAICISAFLSAADIKRNQDQEMPVALRRPSTSLRRRLSEKENALPNGLEDGLSNADSSHKKAKAAACVLNETLHIGTVKENTRSQAPKVSAPAAASNRKAEKDGEKGSERNIDNVVFGDRMFKAWYPSWYPKEIIGEKALTDIKSVGIVVQTLYVCKKCFGYGKEVHEWVKHCQLCEKEVPGTRVYLHGAGEGKTEEECVWSVWEVDGGVDTIFCQNLSLFAKLFLDNKSVFFDVSGFNYFLLVHNPTAQIVGFFSKEKMSWDNNNLACILVFPPWQRKNLGLILMGVSYEISRREEILGGPEKPISDLGKKGYKRYWGREIARWLLEARETDKKKGKGMITVADVSRGTWIHGEDCLAVLRDMGVVERGGKGRGEVERVILDKVKVRDWVEKMNLSLERVVDREGFAEGYGYKEIVEDEEDAGD